ncbi:unnamed protein product [Haemonchus placei]|uniref:Mariner Mos1 transposase n=1 Tax=Haemonchus placei TaxID=6290 RepID=A0A0N4W1C9_HAEPC|nr:unnamed protein product [Haemonchus placei]
MKHGWVCTQPKRHKRRVLTKADEKSPEMVHEELRGYKRMLIMAMDFWDVAFWRLCPEKMTVTAEVYRQFLDDNIDNRMAAHNFKKPIIAHDSAKPHASRIVQQFLEERKLSKRGFNRRILPASSRTTSTASVK